MTFWPVMKFETVAIGLVGLISLKLSMKKLLLKGVLVYLITLLPVMKLGRVGFGLISLRTFTPVIP